MIQYEIAYVDDDEDDRFLFAEAFNRLKLIHRLTVFEHSPEFQQKLKEGTEFHLVFMDINMPVVDGLKCLKELKALNQTAHIPVVMLSSSRSERDIKESFEWGAHYYLIKPVAHLHLVDSISKIISIDWSIAQARSSMDNFVIDANVIRNRH
jgi:CheY-like chemotaxis protein